MTATSGSAQKIADEFVRAWLGRDVEKALSFLADDVVCEAPNGRFEGLARYREFLEPFASALISGTVIDVLGDDTHAATVYTTDTPFAKDFRGMDYVTVKDGRITHMISVFDLLPAAKAGGDPQH
ncbi:nuclear transport factor 2 family protein [Streptomyces sp. ME19-01-6]|uniref:nuclear transport factor 2 family protein n=1 Tax=Streptomyces sp. ME19-01-6 TaxID=3028686 RepID=UPI0029B9A79F|nr:nuclear transport factor 2 family protein [Streptomyces sp. ME19-01-6]MDX3224932.1 nuclear transport factor 2 family protein [Streptomyces sp. ME19-01-6]